MKTTLTRTGEVKLSSFLTAQWVPWERIFPLCCRSENLRVTREQVKPLCAQCYAVICTFPALHSGTVSCSEDKTLLFSSRFTKLTGISHSIIIIAFPSVFQSQCEERTRHRRQSLANERLDFPLPATYHYPFNSTISIIKGQQKEMLWRSLKDDLDK